jgi:predicted flap endonuclease-1-like 5' DNA nuclease
MGYLITQIIICLLIAAIIGFVIGWLLRGLGCNTEEAYESESIEKRSFQDTPNERGDSDSNNTPEINTLSSTEVSTRSNNALDDLAVSEGTSAGSRVGAALAASSGALAEKTTKAPVTKAPAISHPIERIEGIGKNLGNYLRNIGIKTTADLIAKCSTENGFQQVVKAGEVVEPVVKQWLSRADLMRVPKVNGQYAELMEASDIKSVQDLANANAQALTTKMQTVNQREHRIPDSIPLADASMVASWITDAKTLPRKI